MLLFRSLTTGLLAACVVLLATSHQEQSPQRYSTLAAATELAPQVSVVDVAWGVATTQLVSLIHLQPGEHVTGIGDRVLHSDFEAGAEIAAVLPRSGSFVD